MYQIAIITTWHEENWDTLQETHFRLVKSLEPEFIEAEALAVSYDIADEAFVTNGNFVFAEDKERGYTEEQGRIWIDHQTIICNNPETNQLQTIHTRDGDCHECWTKPEEDA